MTEPTEIIATRTLDRLDAHGKPVTPVVVSLGRPQSEPDLGDFRCAYRVRGLGDEAFYGASGVDGLQAMASALLVVGSTLAGESDLKTGRLQWAGRSYFRAGFLRVHMAPEEGLPAEFGRVLAQKTAQEVRDAYRRQGPVTIAVGYPQEAPSGLWFCPYRVAGRGVDCTFWTSGFESMHALESALFVVEGFEDHVSELFQRHERWAGSDVLGFPMLPEP